MGGQADDPRHGCANRAVETIFWSADFGRFWTCRSGRWTSSRMGVTSKMDIDTETARPTPGLVESLWRYRLSSLALVLVAARAGAGYVTVRKPMPHATAGLSLADPRGSSVFRQGTAVPVDLARYTVERAEFARS